MDVAGSRRPTQAKPHRCPYVFDHRADLNISAGKDWSLVSDYPGHLFEQPMDLAFEPGRGESVMTLSQPGRLPRDISSPAWQEHVHR